MKTLYLHVGIHKTGTTSIQAFITANDSALRAGGIFVPRAGRLTRRWGTPNTGHHNIAWNLNDLSNFEPDEGSFDDLLLELRTSDAPVAVVSSEDFEWLHAKPHVLARMRDEFRSAGYETKVIVYLRAQHEYLQAVYIEGAKAGYLYGMDYDRNMREILETGAYTPDPRVVVQFEYEKILDAFAAAFGHESTIVRPYRLGRDPAYILNEFVEIVDERRNVAFANLGQPPPLNVSPSLYNVLVGMHRGVVQEKDPAAPAPQRLLDDLTGDEASVANLKFNVMTEAEIARLLERFAPNNRDIERRYGVSVPFLSEADFPRGDRARWDVVDKQRSVLFHALAAWKIV